MYIESNLSPKFKTKEKNLSRFWLANKIFKDLELKKNLQR